MGGQIFRPPHPPMRVVGLLGKTPVFKAQRGVCFILGVFLILSYVHYTSHLANFISPRRFSDFSIPVEQNTPIILWSTDFHISPIADVKSFLAKHFVGQVQVIDKSLSGHCHLTNTCQTDLMVINKDNGISLSPCPNALRRRFYDHYKSDPEFKKVDAIICTHAMSLCELYMPFGKPLIVIASTRYEIGRYDATRWKLWNRNLERIASKSYNTIAANNLYDQEYLKYFLNQNAIEYLPNLCEYVGNKYLGNKREILLAPARGIHPLLEKDLFIRLQNHSSFTRKDRLRLRNPSRSIVVRKIRDLYPHYQYSDLAAHPAIILLPYQVSFMSFFEFYQMEIPMFVPSPTLLATWHQQYLALSERTWTSALTGQASARSAIPRATNSSCRLTSDPNDDIKYQAILDWVSLSDFYTFPHIRQFSSWDDLFQQLDDMTAASYREVSNAMAVYNRVILEQQVDKWAAILDKIRSSRSERPSGVLQKEATDIDSALRREYGFELHSNHCLLQVEV